MSYVHKRRRAVSDVSDIIGTVTIENGRHRGHTVEGTFSLLRVYQDHKTPKIQDGDTYKGMVTVMGIAEGIPNKRVQVNVADESSVRVELHDAPDEDQVLRLNVDQMTRPKTEKGRKAWESKLAAVALEHEKQMAALAADDADAEQIQVRDENQEGSEMLDGV